MVAIRNRAPEFPYDLEWLNAAVPVRLREQLGRVVLLDFCAFSAVTCRQLQAELGHLAMKYRRDLVILGVHSPRYPGEAGTRHLRQSLDRFRVAYPVVNDPELKLWRAFGLKGLPTQVLVDRDGCIAGVFTGPARPQRLEQVIRYQCNRRSRVPPRNAAPPAVPRLPDTSRVLAFPGRVLAAGNRLYIADSAHNRILVTTPGGAVLRRYGGDSEGFLDGNGESAAFDNPQGMVLADDFLYVADTGNNAIRRIHVRTDDVDTVAGNGAAAPGAIRNAADPRACSLNSPQALAMKDGMLYIAMAGANQIWRLSLVRNRIEVFSGTGEPGLVDGPSYRAAFAQPSGLAFIGQRLYVADADAGAVRSVDAATGAATTLVGRGLYGFGNRDGDGRTALLHYPLDLAADPRRRLLWVADTYNNKLRRIEFDSGHVSSPALDCGLNEPGGLAFHDDTLYIANTNAHEILCLNPSNGHASVLNVAEQPAEIRPGVQKLHASG